MAKQKIIAVIIIVAIALTIHYRLVLDGRAIPYVDASDSLLYGVFMQNFVSDSFRTHRELPLWNPYLWSGAPMIGNSQTAVFYPPAWIFIALSFTAAIKLYYIFHTIIAGVLMYFLARELRLGNLPSIVAALVFMTTGSVHALNVQHYFSNFILWLPGIILFYRLAVRKRNYIYAIIAGALIAIQFMGCHPQLFIFSMMFFSTFCLMDLYGTWKCNRSLRGLWEHSRYIIISAIIAVGLSIFHIIGMLQFSSMSTRINAGGLSFAAEISLAPDELLSLFLHPAIGGGAVIFIGLVPLFLGAASLFETRSREVKFFICAALFSLLFALGKYSPLFYVCYYVLPGFKLFRNPYYGAFFFSLSLTVLTGYGAQFLFVDIRKTIIDKTDAKKLYTKVAAASGVLVILVLGYFAARSPLSSLYKTLNPDGIGIYASGVLGGIHGRTGINILLLGTLVLTCISAVVFLMRRNGIVGGKTWKFVLLSLVAIELLSSNMMSLKTEDADMILGRNKLIDFLADNSSGYRVLNMGGDRILNQTLAGKHNVELADGYDPMMLKDYQLFMNSSADMDKPTASTKLQLTEKGIEDIKHWKPLDLLGIKYILSPEKVEGSKLRLVAEFNEIEMYCHNKGMTTIPEIFVYENPDALPRVFLTANVKPVSQKETLNELKRVESKEAQPPFLGERKVY